MAIMSRDLVEFICASKADIFYNIHVNIYFLSSGAEFLAERILIEIWWNATRKCEDSWFPILT